MPALTPDYIFTAQFFLPDSRQQNVIKNGGIAVNKDTIVAVGNKHDLLSKFPNSQLIQEKHGLIMPGLINTHTHAAMSGFRGMTVGLPLKRWLEKHILSLDVKLASEIVYRSTLLSISEMIKSGTTSICDMFVSAKNVAQAIDLSGIRGWVGELQYDSCLTSSTKTVNNLTYTEELFAEYNTTELITVTSAPHSVTTCSPKLLKRLATLANSNNSLLTIHLLENLSESRVCFERYGVHPIQHLESLGLLGPTTLASHCVKLSQDEIKLLKKYDVKVAHCIESDMKLASGIAPAVDLLKNNVTLSIGTGSSICKIADMFSEMNSVAKLHKVECMDPRVMSAEETLKSATLGGAAALGVTRHIGSLEVGKKADFIVIDLDQPHMTPMYNIPSHLTYVARGGDVKHSFVNGAQLMKNRELLTLDEDRLFSDMKKIINKTYSPLFN